MCLFNILCFLSPIAFPGRPLKPQLDPAIIYDIVPYLADRCNISTSDVRHLITMKCADEAKMMAMRKKTEAAVCAVVLANNNMLFEQ